ncbi:polycomb protein Su(z)12 isoform X3 [Bactrocera neohumeralis]|uniref:polycomb protein Su(z)12-like isoform X3 n=1 Tax=Bactrocera tryoni TaxID=59916 RepID=UPI001A98C4E2|nr:polycomb protein Su(z)12-like isoform X3 [Bactrocera tryoni]XP_050334411.1 polycomb protein Su(z)12 isoform X3 [Bactrocera neohumeralis]
MAPAKKREKDNALAAPAAAISNVANGSVNSVNGGGVSSATAAAASAVTASTASINVDNVKLNGHQQEQELFLQAFEKPTQIYRFLRNRHGTSPIFLNRTLSYMKDRMSRNNKKRTTFKVNSILQQITQKAEIDSNKYLNIIYNGLFDKSSCSDQWWNAGESVSVEATLYKITKNKRKDSTSDFQEVMSYSSDVEYNPDHDISRFSTISIPVQSMRPLGDQHTIYKLLFRIKVLPKCDKNAIDENTENCETPCKRGKISTKIYGCELIVFEKNICFIPEGDYEAAMQELNSMSIKSFSPKKRTWETLPDNYIPLSLKFDVFNQFPTLKFRLTWSANEVPSSIDAKDFNLYGDLAFIKNEANDKIQNNPNEVEMPFNSNANQTKNIGTHVNHNNNCVKTNGAKSGIVPVSAKVEKIQIVYNFLYSNNTRQQTEYTQEVICPWCGLDCLRLYALLKHLKLCHARFNFTYQPAGNGARIDVTINDSYDGSYAGSPYDLAGPSGCSFARTCGPVRRTTVTNLLVCRPRRQKTCLDEFLVLDEDDLSNQRPYITGHNRLYHHTETCLPVHPKELDIDSEGESDPLWLRQKTIQMIDEFSDVNEGEKELMKLWNLHVMKHGYVGDCQLPLACEMFLDSNGYEIIRKNLYRNFILHMCSLFDYGLVSPETVYKTVQKLQGMLSKYPEGQELMSKQREAQLKYWLDVGIHKQDEQKLKSPQKQTLKPTNISEVLGTADNDVCGTSSVSKNTENKPMQPPTKRSATAVKRASLHLQNGNGNSTSDKLINGCGSKGVAKKTASQAVDDQEPPANTSANSGSAKMPSDKRERRGEACSNSRRSSTASAAVTLTTIDRDENNESKDAQNLERPHRGGSVSTNSTTTAESRTQTSKRRLSVKVIEDVEGGGNGGECGYIGADNNREAFEANNNASDVCDATVSNIPQTVFQSELTQTPVKYDASHLNTDTTERDVHAVDDGKDIDDYLTAELRADVTTASTITSDATVATTTEADNVL